MKLSNFIDGLNILRPYYKDGDGYHLGAEHDEIYLYGTASPVSPEDLQKLKALGWSQSSDLVEIAGDEWEPSDYDAEQGWRVFT